MLNRDHRIINECRSKYLVAVRSGFRPEYESSRSALEARLFRRGVLIWACVVKANDALYTHGTIDLRGCVVFSFDPYFDGRAAELEAIADTVFSTRRLPPEDSSIGKFAKIVSEDRAFTPRSLIPASLTGGQEVWYEELYFVRSRLPAGCLLDRLLPIITNTDASSGVMVPPINCWANELVDDWTSKATERPPAVIDVRSAVSLEEFLADPLVITPAAAKELQRVVLKQRLKRASLRVGHERGAYSMDLTEALPNHDDFSYKSQRIRLIVNQNCAEALMGMELDFKGGYTFQKRAEGTLSNVAPRSWWARLLRR